MGLSRIEDERLRRQIYAEDKGSFSVIDFRVQVVDAFGQCF
jgi:hypothetical protein